MVSVPCRFATNSRGEHGPFCGEEECKTVDKAHKNEAAAVAVAKDLGKDRGLGGASPAVLTASLGPKAASTGMGRGRWLHPFGKSILQMDPTFWKVSTTCGSCRLAL